MLLFNKDHHFYRRVFGKESLVKRLQRRGRAELCER